MLMLGEPSSTSAASLAHDTVSALVHGIDCDMIEQLPSTEIVALLAYAAQTHIEYDATVARYLLVGAGRRT
jgi:hypothetical protein